jgi:hypothetical protein
MSSKWVKFEDTSALGSFHRMVEIDTIDDANEQDTERDASGERTKDVAEELDSLRRAQLGRSDLFLPSAHRNRGSARSSQVLHPMDLAPGRPDPPPARDIDDRDWRGARQAALPAANRDEPIEPERHAGDQKELQESAEEPDSPRSPDGGGWSGACCLRRIEGHGSHPSVMSCQEDEPRNPTDVTSRGRM